MLTWTYTNLLVQMIAGFLGAHAAALMAREYSFGALGHSVTGALAGALSGYFLQPSASTLLSGGGGLTGPTALEQVILQGLAGAGSGAILMLAVGFIKHRDTHKRP